METCEVLSLYTCNDLEKYLLLPKSGCFSFLYTPYAQYDMWYNSNI